MEPLTEAPRTSWPFPFVPQDWERTPAPVQSYVRSLHDELTQLRERVEALEAREKLRAKPERVARSRESGAHHVRKRSTETTSLS